ncbi:MAG TPA: transglycosylase domain-containing protein [Caldimonas sp.]|jgi:monofunctional biosynthetic peptidoglycan transglycosylase|nr:transglycosylase domain-containing protein [Caldimonas sp.]
MTTARGRSLRRFAELVIVSLVALQLFFIARIALMAIVDPQSTTFQRSEAWRLALEPHGHGWRQQWTDYPTLSANLKRAVIAAEDSGFTEHSGVEWDALEKAWDKNERADQVAEQAAQRAPRRDARTPAKAIRPAPAPKIVGGSTITQQLAKNLFLSGERNFLRKAQELVLSYELEAILGKRRILEIYLNEVEWGEGVFGAGAAARRYFGLGAGELGGQQAAQLAVMLPAPKRFEKRPGSAYVVGRAATIVARMGRVDVP